MQRNQIHFLRIIPDTFLDLRTHLVDDTKITLIKHCNPVQDLIDKTKLFFRAEFPDTVIQKRLKNRCILRTDCNDLTRCNQNTKRYGRIRFFFMTDLDRRDIDQNESITIL